MRKWICFGMFFPLVLSAEIILLEPTADQTIPLVPQNQKALIAMESHAARKEFLAADRQKGEDSTFFNKKNRWRQALPVTFRWECTAGEKNVCIVLSETPDFQNPKRFGPSRDAQKYTPPNYELNLKLGQKYYWKVTANGGKVTSKVFSFTTEAHPPRWIAVAGKVGNIRDLGGWKTTDGYTVKQGRLFRGQGLNYNSFDLLHKGRNRLMVEDVYLLCDELGIKTDLDLRSKGETADMQSSPLGEKVNFIQISSACYMQIHSENGKKTMIRDFRVLADPKNHPVYFHCIGGYDRTGAVAFIANGVLGVPEKDLASDWEQTSLPNLPDLPPVPEKEKWRDFDGMVKGFYKYGKPGDSLKVCIENYLLSGGVTPEEIATFRETMLQK